MAVIIPPDDQRNRNAKNQVGGLSWGAVVLALILFWPLGLALLVIKIVVEASKGSKENTYQSPRSAPPVRQPTPQRQPAPQQRPNPSRQPAVKPAPPQGQPAAQKTKAAPAKTSSDPGRVTQRSGSKTSYETFLDCGCITDTHNMRNRHYEHYSEEEYFKEAHKSQGWS